MSKSKKANPKAKCRAKAKAKSAAAKTRAKAKANAKKKVSNSADELKVKKGKSAKRTGSTEPVELEHDDANVEEIPKKRGRKVTKQKTQAKVKEEDPEVAEKACPETVAATKGKKRQVHQHDSDQDESDPTAASSKDVVIKKSGKSKKKWTAKLASAGEQDKSDPTASSSKNVSELSNPKRKSKKHTKMAGKSKQASKTDVKETPKEQVKVRAKSDEFKARQSRKSAAYHRAKKEALAAGDSEEEAKQKAKEVTLIKHGHGNWQSCLPPYLDETIFNIILFNIYYKVGFLTKECLNFFDILYIYI